MRPGHGDVECAPDKVQVPGRIQGDLPRWTARTVLLRLLSGTGNRLHGLSLTVDFTNQMVFSVGDVQAITSERHALRPKESRAIEGTSPAPIAPVPITSSKLPSVFATTIRL